MSIKNKQTAPNFPSSHSHRKHHRNRNHDNGHERNGENPPQKTSSREHGRHKVRSSNATCHKSTCSNVNTWEDSRSAREYRHWIALQDRIHEWLSGVFKECPELVAPVAKIQGKYCRGSDRGIIRIPTSEKSMASMAQIRASVRVGDGAPTGFIVVRGADMGTGQAPKVRHDHKLKHNQTKLRTTFADENGHDGESCASESTVKPQRKTSRGETGANMGKMGAA